MHALLGRERELRALDLLLDHVHERGAALVVRGAAGIGKSSLLAAARDLAHERGMHDIEATGVPSETHLPLAGLHQLLRPILDDVVDLPAPQRDALRMAFGMVPALGAQDPFIIALAVLNLLSSAAARTPLLVVADDCQWLDRTTCDVLAFVARRLESDSILLLCAVRDGFPSVLADTDLPEIHLECLDERAAAALLDAQDDALDQTVRRQVLEKAAGHPLALIDLPSALRAAGYGGDTLLPPWLPLTTRLEQAFNADASRLPAPTRALLLVAAADEDASLAEVVSAARQLTDSLPISEEAIEPAVAAGLIELDDSSVLFRHPLTPSALYQAAGAVRCRAAHAALAGVLIGQPDRAIWHRASALFGRDERVASELAAAAGREFDLGQSASAVLALERAVHLSDDPVRQGEWLLKAIGWAAEIDPNLARRLLHSAESLDLALRQREELAWLRQAMLEDGRRWTRAAGARPCEMVERAQREGDIVRAMEYLWLIARHSFWSSPKQAVMASVAAASDRLRVPDLNPKLNAILACADTIESGALILDRLSRLPERDRNPAETWLNGVAATAVGSFAQAAELLNEGVAELRAQGRWGILLEALTAQAVATRYTGDWQVARLAAAEVTRLARETAQPLWMATAQALVAVVDGLRGETDRAEASAAEAERVIRTVSAHPMLAFVQLARGGASLSAGRYAEAFDHLWRVFDRSDCAYHPIVRCWAAGDLVEAAIHSGRREEARVVVRELESVAARSPFPVLLAGLRYARPLLAQDDEAEALFLAGLAADFSDLVLTRERLQLAYGSWLRRHRRVIESRMWLRTARDALDALGVVPWAERARQELRAAGETSRREPGAWDRLTPQERQIALMAAEGLSNREIGQRLYLSHRTVGSHLYRIFPKLGIASRAELHAMYQVAHTSV